jgi:hypothetical protein
LITQVTTFPKRNNRISAFVFNPSGQFCEIYQSLAGEAACRDAVRSSLPSARRKKEAASSVMTQPLGMSSFLWSRKNNSLLGFDLFFQIDFAIAVVEFILQHGERLVGDDSQAEAVIESPFPFEGEDSLVDESCYEWMYVQGESLRIKFVDYKSYLIFELVC